MENYPVSTWSCPRCGERYHAAIIQCECGQWIPCWSMSQVLTKPGTLWAKILKETAQAQSRASLLERARVAAQARRDRLREERCQTHED